MEEKEILKYTFKSEENNDSYELYYNYNEYYYMIDNINIGKRFKTFREALKDVKYNLTHAVGDLKIFSIQSIVKLTESIY